MRSNHRAVAFALLALANLLWAGNWITGRALRGAFDPVMLNFLRWLVALAALAPFALPQLAGMGRVIRRDARMLVLLAATGVALFQTIVYLGLRTTTAVNAVLLNSAAPLVFLLCSWAIERERPRPRQIAGMAISLAGILVILARGEPGRLLDLRFHAGDVWILLAMPAWGLYSVLLKRRPPELGGTAFLFVIAALGVAMLAPVAALRALAAPPRWPDAEAMAGVLYVGLGASVAAFACWNRGVAVVGANAAGFTLHLLPAFGSLLAVLLLGERFAAYNAAGIAIIVAGVALATSRRSRA